MGATQRESTRGNKTVLIRGRRGTGTAPQGAGTDRHQVLRRPRCSGRASAGSPRSIHTPTRFPEAARGYRQQLRARLSLHSQTLDCRGALARLLQLQGAREALVRVPLPLHLPFGAHVAVAALRAVATALGSPEPRARPAVSREVKSRPYRLLGLTRFERLHLEGGLLPCLLLLLRGQRLQRGHGHDGWAAGSAAKVASACGPGPVPPRGARPGALLLIADDVIDEGVLDREDRRGGEQGGQG